jgi:hypothetical protein
MLHYSQRQKKNLLSKIIRCPLSGYNSLTVANGPRILLILDELFDFDETIPTSGLENSQLSSPRLLKRLSEVSP